MSDRPLGIADVIEHALHNATDLPEGTWYWCRVHTQSAEAGVPCKASKSKPSYKRDDFWDAADHMVGTTWEMEYPLEDCVRVGPFGSERVANRLRGMSDDGRCSWDKPLNMKVDS